jgi:hypothetical protein
VFEIEFNKRYDELGMIDAVDAGQIFSSLEHNYGVIGAEYAKILATEHREIGVLVSDTIKRFTARVKGVGDESYWWGICGALLVGAALARRLGAEIDVAAMEEYLVEAFYNNRKIRGQEGTEGGSPQNTEQALTAFVNHYVGSGNALFIDMLHFNRSVKVHVYKEPEKSKPIYIQVVREQRLVIISKRAMREFLYANNIHSRQVFAGLVKYHDAKEIKCTLGAGTTQSQSQEACYQLPVPHDTGHIFHDLMKAYGEVKI